MKNLVLIGFMGTGKTMIGQMLAKRLGLEFVDTDDLIEERFGMSVSDIFSGMGESAFRAAEMEAIAEVSAVDGQVIATGGGAVENPDNVANLRRNGVIVCLTAEPEVILRRTSQKDSRPMLSVDGDRMTRILDLLERRKSCYSAADLQVDTSHDKPEVTVGAIMRYYRRRNEDSQG